ncbi:MAG: hypothetical protein N2512_08485 [Armatimonadetes bacterium]|nr:hypothetical protein [Armatimonadota bacterium]
MPDGDVEQDQDDERDSSEEVLDVEVEPEEILQVEVGDEEVQEAPLGGALGSSVGPSSQGELPPVEQYMVTGALAEELPAVCAAVCQPFLVSAVPAQAGGYDVVGARTLPAGTPMPPSESKGRAVSGVFRLERYPGCPHCGAGGLILCKECGTISCGAVDGKTGQWLPCPGCGSTAPVTQSKQGWTVHVTGKGKGPGKAGKA